MSFRQALHSCFSWLRDIPRLSLRGQRFPQLREQGLLHTGPFLSHGPRGTSGGAALAAGSSCVGESPSTSTTMLPNRSKAVGATSSDVENVESAPGVGVDSKEVALGVVTSLAALGTATVAGLCLLAALGTPGRPLTAGSSEGREALAGADEEAAEEEGAPPEKVGPSSNREVWMARASRTRSRAGVRLNASIRLPSSVASSAWTKAAVAAGSDIRTALSCRCAFSANLKCKIRAV